ncbi:hypothetical protein BURCENBC7_AP2997 [Burkholderia cenocepacia BC7]|nr:hypothetical protein BURCENBC7_AP2997 [Burkholderia cenocepacia BC7]
MHAKGARKHRRESRAPDHRAARFNRRISVDIDDLWLGNGRYLPGAADCRPMRLFRA